ncbi:glycosyltransferase [Virgibacillus sp. NKC19-3]|uniref:glycosyltransferase n=1 Tax=Virgibacillus saliphilus TaxID=2831674 RepID=UPI001C9B7247|nr:glycosyltransferase [Virgibacillus sp. NKC19-3]MBY7142195.1 glycosyltransferase [Virgibacillus sp. NKC19-3]
MISIGMATVPSRFKYLREIVPPLLKQCDNMYIHVNGSHHCPEFLKKESKINLSFSNINKGGQMAFKGIQQTSGYYFCVDDDLIYPDNYVEKMIELMKTYQDQVIACVHGSSFDPYVPVHQVFKNKKNAHLSYKGLDRHRRVMIPGVGTSCMHTNTFTVTPDEFTRKNMRDAVVSCKAAKAGIPIIAIKRKEDWIQKIPVKTEINKNKAYDHHIDELFLRHIPYFQAGAVALDEEES